MTKLDIEAVNRLWRSDIPVAKIAEQLGCEEKSIYGVTRRERNRDGEAKWPYRRRGRFRNSYSERKADEPPPPPPEKYIPAQEILRLHKKGLSPLRIAPLLKVRYADIQAVIDGRAGQ